MGITFRSGDYIRYVRLGGRTIKDGEAAAVWRSDGTHEQIVGPRRVRLFFSTIRFLTRYKADSTQYIVISHRDGKIEHIPGPASFYENPTLHDEVTVSNATILNSELELILVRRNGSNNAEDLKGSLPREDMKRGPLLFVPKPNEHVVTFSWSKVIGASLVPGEDKFQVLHMSTKFISPSIKLPLESGFFLQADLCIEFDIDLAERVVTVNDPIERIYHALLSDVNTLAASVSLASVRSGSLKEIGQNLSSLSSYDSLKKASTSCGLVVRGIYATQMVPSADLLKSMEDERTQQQKMKSEIYRLNQQAELMNLEVKCKKSEIENKAELKTMDEMLDKQMHDMKLESMKRSMTLKLEETKISNQISKLKDEAFISLLKKLKEMEVDVNTFLSSSISATMTSKDFTSGAVELWQRLDHHLPTTR